MPHVRHEISIGVHCFWKYGFFEKNLVKIHFPWKNSRSVPKFFGRYWYFLVRYLVPEKVNSLGIIGISKCKKRIKNVIFTFPVLVVLVKSSNMAFLKDHSSFESVRKRYFFSSNPRWKKLVNVIFGHFYSNVSNCISAVQWWFRLRLRPETSHNSHFPSSGSF